MNKINLYGVIRNIRYSIGKYSPEILTGIGVAGMITSTVVAVKATPKALILIEEEKTRQKRANYEEAVNRHELISGVTSLKKKDVIKVTWKCYIPALLFCVSSSACLIGAGAVNMRRKAALTTAYALSEAAFSEYRKKVVETINEKKEAKIRESIQQDKIDNNPPSQNSIYITEKGDTLCYDSLSGRYFKSDVETIKAAINEINHRLISEMYISLNDLYEEFGLERTVMGDELGWNVDGELIKATFGTHLTKDNQPCVTIEYAAYPRHSYSQGL